MELLRSTVGKIQDTGLGPQLEVTGKGQKTRLVSLTPSAIELIEQNLEARGLPPLETCSGDVLLVTSLKDPGKSPSHAAIHQSLKAFFQDVLSKAQLPARERERMLQASMHWLRHTFATRAAEAGMPVDALMEEMGHTSPTTTAGYYRAQERRRRDEMVRVFG
jgi:integrase